MDEVGSDARLREIASRFSELEHVEAVVVAGSVAVGTSDSQSDYDFYVYSRQPVDVAFRQGLLSRGRKDLSCTAPSGKTKMRGLSPTTQNFKLCTGYAPGRNAN
jgi:predicted nucleotidyltransferase